MTEELHQMEIEYHDLNVQQIREELKRGRSPLGSERSDSTFSSRRSAQSFTQCHSSVAHSFPGASPLANLCIAAAGRVMALKHPKAPGAEIIYSGKLSRLSRA
jgi:hypothetical protein